VIFRTVLLVALLYCAIARGGTYVQFRTPWGDIDVELYDEDKPITVRNFLRYVQSGLYTNMFFHRCPANQFTGLTDFVVQGGGWAVNAMNGSINPVPRFADIQNEFGVGRRFSNTYGTLAMAKVSGNTNSANSEWFFNLNNNSFLDNGPDGYFTVFGRMVRGTNVLNQYLGRSYGNGLQNLTNILGPAFLATPVTYAGFRPPTLNDLEYVDISLLSVKVMPAANGAHEISWNSLNTNRYCVEYTTNLPPDWHLLIQTNGIGRFGETMRITDPATTAPRRFYRVRQDL
jgi:cyclophilin family peptidyl-prolyl cis-trans isomerase